MKGWIIYVLFEDREKSPKNGMENAFPAGRKKETGLHSHKSSCFWHGIGVLNKFFIMGSISHFCGMQMERRRRRKIFILVDVPEKIDR